MSSASVKFQTLEVVLFFFNVLHAKNILHIPPPRNSLLSFKWSKKTLKRSKRKRDNSGQVSRPEQPLCLDALRSPSAQQQGTRLKQLHLF